MKTIIKKIFITYLAIICCIYTPTAQAAGWNFGGFNFGNGSLNITKNGVKITTAPVSTAPITSNLGSKILSGALRGAGFLSALSIAVDIGEGAIDWVLDTDNNAIKYKDKNQPNSAYYYYLENFQSDTKEGVCALMHAANGNGSSWIGNISWSGDMGEFGRCVGSGYSSSGWTLSRGTKTQTNDYKTIPIPTVAQKILDMAKSGDTNAQADVTSAVNELVSAGTYDTPINQAIQDAVDNGTLPKDTDTNNPTNPTKPEIDTSSITAAIQSLASSFASAISNAFNGITSVINTSMDKILNKQDQIQGEVVNVGSKVDSVGGQVVGVGDKVDAAGDKVGTKVDAVGEKVTTVGDKVVGVGDKVDAAGDKVGTKVDAVGEKVTTVVTAISNSFNAITSVINTSIDKLLNKQDQIQGEVVNVGSKVDSVGGQVVGVGDKVDNVGGKVVGVGDAVKDVGGKVVGLNDSVDKVGDKVVGVGDKVDAAGDKVGDKVDAAGEKVGTKVDAVGEKVTGVGDKVVGVGDKVDAAGEKVGTKVDAVGEKVTGVGTRVDAVGEKVDAAGEKTAEAIKESTKEITKKMDETKPKDFELPAFCSWASKVCDFIDWVKESPPEELPPQQVKNGTLQDIDLDTFDRYQKRIYFPPHCPSKTFELSVLGVHIVKPVDFSGLCSVLEAIAPWLLAATYISCAFFVIREI